MTWWAAVLGFVGGLASTWGGQLLASKRDDRRWERERVREDIRWHRDRRILTYTEFTNLMEQIYNEFKRWAENLATGSKERPDLSKIQELVDKLEEQTSLVEIVGSKYAVDVVLEGNQAVVYAYRDLRNASKEQFESGNYEPREVDVQEIFDKMGGILLAFRIDVLGEAHKQ